jgi:Recombination directionality factor-like
VAIPGITDRIRYQRLGKIRLGEKALSARGAQYPKATDHFVFDEGAAAVAKAYPGHVTAIFPVFLPGNPKRATNGAWDFSDYWKTSRSAYGASSGLFCRSTDGVTATRTHKGFIEDKDPKRNGKPMDPQGFHYIQENKLDVQVGEMFDLPCPGEECVYFEKKMCKNLGSLDMMLPKVAGFGV